MWPLFQFGPTWPPWFKIRATTQRCPYVFSKIKIGRGKRRSYKIVDIRAATGGRPYGMYAGFSLSSAHFIGFSAMYFRAAFNSASLRMIRS